MNYLRNFGIIPVNPRNNISECLRHCWIYSFINYILKKLERFLPIWQNKSNLITLIYQSSDSRSYWIQLKLRQYPSSNTYTVTNLQYTIMSEGKLDPFNKFCCSHIQERCEAIHWKVCSTCLPKQLAYICRCSEIIRRRRVAVLRVVLEGGSTVTRWGSGYLGADLSLDNNKQTIARP